MSRHEVLASGRDQAPGRGCWRTQRYIHSEDIGQEHTQTVSRRPLGEKEDHDAVQFFSRHPTSNGKLLVTKGIATNGARTLLVAPGICTSNKNATRNGSDRLCSEAEAELSNLMALAEALEKTEDPGFPPFFCGRSFVQHVQQWVSFWKVILESMKHLYRGDW